MDTRLPNPDPPPLRSTVSSATRATAPASSGVQPDADARCIAAILAGKPDLFTELIDRYQRAVVTAVRGYIRDPHDAEDVAQDVFINAFSALHQLRDPRYFYPWLLQIARHRAAQSGRKQARRSVERPLTGEEPFAAPEPAAKTGIMSSVEQLPEPYRAIILLKYERDMSCKEIAEQEGVAIGTITSRLTRALSMLRNSFPEGRPA